MRPIKCKDCGFPLELVEKRSDLEIFRCSTCGKQETVEIEQIPKGMADFSESEPDFEQDERKSEDSGYHG